MFSIERSSQCILNAENVKDVVKMLKVVATTSLSTKAASQQNFYMGVTEYLLIWPVYLFILKHMAYG